MFSRLAVNLCFIIKSTKHPRCLTLITIIQGLSWSITKKIYNLFITLRPRIIYFYSFLTYLSPVSNGKWFAPKTPYMHYPNISFLFLLTFLIRPLGSVKDTFLKKNCVIIHSTFFSTLMGPCFFFIVLYIYIFFVITSSIFCQPNS